MKFLIVYDTRKSEAIALATRIKEYLKARGIELQIRRDIIQKRGLRHRESTIALILGGDGFIVKNAMQLAGTGVQLLGINFGTVGFLAPVEPEDWEKALEKLFDGRYKIIQDRLLRGALKSKDEKTREFEAVNDVVLVRGLQKIVGTRVERDASVVYRNIRGDGIIICSAIGSTAYNLAAGGSVFQSGIGITPLAIHRTDVKPLIPNEDTRVTVTCLGGSKAIPEEFSLEVDGHGICNEPNLRTIVRPGDEISVCYGNKIINRIEAEGFDFVQALQKKLGLSR